MHCTHHVQYGGQRTVANTILDLLIDDKLLRTLCCPAYHHSHMTHPPSDCEGVDGGQWGRGNTGSSGVLFIIAQLC